MSIFRSRASSCMFQCSSVPRTGSGGGLCFVTFTRGRVRFVGPNGERASPVRGQAFIISSRTSGISPTFSEKLGLLDIPTGQHCPHCAAFQAAAAPTWQRKTGAFYFP